MTLMPEVQQALVDAMAARTAPRRRSRRPLRWCALAAGAVAMTGTAVAATGAWRTELGDDHRGHPRAARLPVPPAQPAELAVLRRPQRDADRGPAVRAVLALLVRGEIDGVHTEGIRLLDDRDGKAVVLVPTERVGRHDAGFDSSLRRDVLCLEVTGRTASAEARVLDGRGRTVRVRHPGGPVVAESCGTAAQLGTTGITAIAADGRRRVRRVGLVPDGVAAVALHLSDGARVRAEVSSNVYVATLAAGAAVGAVDWLDAMGARRPAR